MDGLHYLRDPGTDGVGVAFTDATLDLASGRDADRTRLQRMLGLERLVTVSQVHGADVVDADADVDPGTEADALVASRRGTGVCVRVADCMPVALADPATGLVAAAHTGRVGFLAGVLPATVAALRARGAAHLTAWLGPHVCGACYEVPQEMVDAVAAKHPAAVATTSWGTPALDLGAAAVAQLTALGVDVATDPACTLESSSLHSYRRDRERSGRLALVVWRA